MTKWTSVGLEMPFDRQIPKVWFSSGFASLARVSVRSRLLAQALECPL
jgi:hypothetical protein